MPELSDYLLAWFVWNVLGPLLAGLGVMLLLIAFYGGLFLLIRWGEKKRRSQ